MNGMRFGMHAIKRPMLSSTLTARNWLSQFSAQDRPAAARMLDHLLLLNEEQVATSLRRQLLEIARQRSGLRKHIALYAEREIAEKQIFQVQRVPDVNGRVRYRAVGKNGPQAVKPVRGQVRVGSEGWIAFIISQVVKASNRIALNQPGPDRIRAHKVGQIILVTDFIGSGTRILNMLGKFWAVPSVRAWASRRWIKFHVVAVAGTGHGIETVRRHRSRPTVQVDWICPTIAASHHAERRRSWEDIIERYGPPLAGDGGRKGYKDTGALIACSYGIPNNAPLILHTPGSKWQPLFQGAAPDDLRDVFGVRSDNEIMNAAAAMVGIELASDLDPSQARTVLVLSALRRRWHRGAEIAVAEQTTLSETEVLAILASARTRGLIDVRGRLTDAGQDLVAAGGRRERKRPAIPTSTKPYYPLELRTPRTSSSLRRPKRRPK